MRTTLSTPTDLVCGLQHARMRHSYARALLRLRQSEEGLALAAKQAKDPALAERLDTMASARRTAAASLYEVANEFGLTWRHRRDVFGVIHRAWLRMISGTGDEAILDEVDRGEEALRRSVVRLLNRRVASRVRHILARVHMQVCEDIERMKAERIRRTGPFRVPNEWPAMPPFRAPASTGQTLDAERYRGKLPLVLFFVPDGLSRRSGRRIAEFNRSLVRFGQLRTQVIGVVPERASDLRDQARRRNYNLPLLADPDGAIHQAFGLDKDDAAISWELNQPPINPIWAITPAMSG